jgi:hypothetical protein
MKNILMLETCLRLELNCPCPPCHLVLRRHHCHQLVMVLLL